MVESKPLPIQKVDSLVAEKSHVGIRKMFDEIAPNYDFLNHLLSGGSDFYWRFKARREAEKILKSIASPKILDMATGTGDLAIELSKIPNSSVIGVDLSDEMLTVARNKKTKIDFQNGSAESINFSDHSFDLVSAGFGVRNFQDLNKGLNEFYRVLKPEGAVIIIEPMIPRQAFIKKLYLWYFKNALPKIAGLFSKSDFAYSYLPRSVESFPQCEAFVSILKQAGFRQAGYITLTFETAILYIARK